MNRRAYLFLVCLLIGTAGALPPPRLRPSPFFGNILGMKYTSIDDLGFHHYSGGGSENNSLIYTASAGYIDLGHLRESADRTRYIFQICYESLMNHQTDFSYKVIEMAEYHVHIDYPVNWEDLDPAQQAQICRRVAIDLGQHFAQQSTIWHEIVTWYGYASTGIFAEDSSSFSWEDGYSDLLGTKIAAAALEDEVRDYDAAMTGLIVQELRKLDPQPAETAKEATERIKGKWYSGTYPLLTMKKRNFDVGFDDGQISPFRVPGICPEAEEIPCAVPALESPERYGLSIRLTMTPHESERHPILRIIYPDGKGQTLSPEEDFPKIVEAIRKIALSENRDVDKPVL